jgi:hypothetical protein
LLPWQLADAWTPSSPMATAPTTAQLPFFAAWQDALGVPLIRPSFATPSTTARQPVPAQSAVVRTRSSAA